MWIKTKPSLSNMKEAEIQKGIMEMVSHPVVKDFTLLDVALNNIVRLKVMLRFNRIIVTTTTSKELVIRKLVIMLQTLLLNDLV